MRFVAPLLVSLLLVQSVEGRGEGLPSGPRTRTKVTTVEQANKLAAEVLAKHFADHVDEKKQKLDVANFNALIRFPRSRWDAAAFRRHGPKLEQGLASAAGFLAQLASDWGSIDLHVMITPDGDLIRTEGAAHASLFVPLGAMNETELRSAYDDGKFIHADHWWSIPAHMSVAKRRALWQVRNKLRLAFRKAALLLVGDINQLRGKTGKALREGTRRLVERAIGPEVEDSKGRPLQRDLLSRVDAAPDDKSLITFLKRWRQSAADPRNSEGAAEFMAGALQGGNKVTDERNIWALIQVETIDAVTVAPEDVLRRHGGPLLNEVTLKGTRVALIHVTSVDTVAVVPNLARMLLGGATAERAQGALAPPKPDATDPAASSLREALEESGD